MYESSKFMRAAIISCCQWYRYHILYWWIDGFGILPFQLCYTAIKMYNNPVLIFSTILFIVTRLFTVRIRKASKPICFNIYVSFYLLEIQVAWVRRVPRKVRPKTPSKSRKLRPKTPSKSRKLRPKTPSKSRKLRRLKHNRREGVLKTLCSTQKQGKVSLFQQ